MTSRTPGVILVVDDNEANRELLVRRLSHQGHTVFTANNGREALNLVQQHPFDLMLLDIMMPELNGYGVLEYLNGDPELRHLPVIVISAVDDVDSIVRCIQMGAEDYLFKPFNPTLLNARVGASLEKKRLRDQERAYLEMLSLERARSDRLLLNILPGPIAERLKRDTSTIADHFPEVSVLFADIVDFTETTTRVPPAEMIGLLNQIFSAFDELAEQHGLEKIKTIGDAYMVVGGLPTPRPDHAGAVAEMALDMLAAVKRFTFGDNQPIQLRIGINSGPVIAGVIGTKKFSYDLWGDTVNIASRMEALSIPNQAQVTQATYTLLEEHYTFAPRGLMEVKGKGEMFAYLLTGRRIVSPRPLPQP